MVPHTCSPALGSRRWEDHKFQANLGYIARPCFTNTKTNKQIIKDWKDGWNESLALLTLVGLCLVYFRGSHLLTPY
jgi:hypothetical protein